MCFSTDARPPDHGIGGAIGSSEDLVLAASDGNHLAARLARPAQPTGTGVVILPDVRGLHNFYRDLACRFAEAGLDALAIDYFGRTDSTGNRGDDFDFMSHLRQTEPESIDLDVGAALQYLGGLGDTRLFTIGFCFGGAASWRQSATQPGLSGAIGFYGVPSRVADQVADMIAPLLLLLLAGADRRTPQAEFADFNRRLTDAGLPHRMVVYEGAPHSFFDRSHQQWQDASTDAWKEILAFIKDPAPPAATV
jgi:carboxymethylenebutenolidase